MQVGRKRVGAEAAVAAACRREAAQQTVSRAHADAGAGSSQNSLSRSSRKGSFPRKCKKGCAAGRYCEVAEVCQKWSALLDGIYRPALASVIQEFMRSACGLHRHIRPASKALLPSANQLAGGLDNSFQVAIHTQELSGPCQDRLHSCWWGSRCVLASGAGKSQIISGESLQLSAQGEKVYPQA